MSQEAVKRLANIQDEINALVKEGIDLAEEHQLTFRMGDSEFAGMYGLGNLRYVADGSSEHNDRLENENEYYYDEWQQKGWLSSSSECD